MCKEILMSGDFDIKKINFTAIRLVESIRINKDVEIEKVLVSNKISFGEKKL